MELMQPKTQDPNQQQANVILKFLPLMIGWFSLNVPAALCIYWVANNIITTATTVFPSGVEYFAGDYLLAEAGLEHGTFFAPKGALFMIRSELVEGLGK